MNDCSRKCSVRHKKDVAEIATLSAQNAKLSKVVEAVRGLKE